MTRVTSRRLRRFGLALVAYGMGTGVMLPVMHFQFLMSDKAMGYFLWPAMLATPIGLMLYFHGRYQQRP